MPVKRGRHVTSQQASYTPWLAKACIMVGGHCAFGCTKHFARAKGIGFYHFPEYPEDIRKKWIQAIKRGGLHQNIREYAVPILYKCWGGRAINKFITHHSGFLDNVEDGYKILADGGFDIADDLGIYGSHLGIPSL